MSFGLWEKAETKLESSHTGTRRACKNRQGPELASGLETRTFAQGKDDTEPLLANILYSRQSICLRFKVLWVSSIFTSYALWSQHDMLLRIHMMSVYCFVLFFIHLNFHLHFGHLIRCRVVFFSAWRLRQLFSKPWVSDIIL